MHTRKSYSRAILFTLAVALALPAALTAQQEAPQDLLSQADKVLHQMSEMTGLPIREPLRKQVVNRTEIRKYLAANLHREVTPAELHAQEAALRAFGVVPPSFNLEEFLITFYTEQAAGFYDPHTKTMFIADWIPADMQTTVLAHELTHALQDQSFDLEKFLHTVRTNEDASNARQALVEGYATAAMMQQMTAPLNLADLPSLQPLLEGVIHQQFEEYPAFSHAPYFFRVEALFPYVDGIGFIQQALQQGGWKALNKVFSDPPATTRQIYDPSTYFAHAARPEISLPQPPALAHVAGLAFLREDTLGELGFRALLGQLVSEEEAEAVGPAWVADRYLLYERPGGEGYTLVARARWGNEETAREFFHDYLTLLKHKYPGLPAAKPEDTDLFRGAAASGEVLLVRSGDECRWVEGVPANRADDLWAWLRAL